MGESAFHLWWSAMVLIAVPTDCLFPHQGLFLSLLFLQNFPHEVSLVHWSSNDFQVICVDDYLSKIYNGWRLEKWRMSIVIHHQTPNTGLQNLFNIPGSRREGTSTVQRLQSHQTPKNSSLPGLLLSLKTLKTSCLLPVDGNQPELSLIK